MVKNKKGGSRHKKMARKGQTDPDKKEKLRYPNNDAEIIACITKVYGHGMAEVMCNDGITRLCIIRKKFKGRNKRDNFIKLNGLVLVGRREWEIVAEHKKQKVDLIYVYSDNQLDDLKKNTVINDVLIGKKDEEDIGFIIQENIDENTKIDMDAI